MRRLVPEKNEVPALIDDISTKAKVRGINIGRFEPLTVEPGAPSTRTATHGDLGSLRPGRRVLADIASLPRIIVPQDVALKSASQGVRSSWATRWARARGELHDPHVRQGRGAAAPPAEEGGSEAGGARE